MIKDINENIELKIFKCRNVKTPNKSWEAAGWDFYIPENLSIFDFAKNYKTYLDSSVVNNEKILYTIPLIFYLKSKRTVGEFKCRLYLDWNENDIPNTKEAAEKRQKEWLFSPDGRTDARVRNEGLFQKFRDSEL